MINLYWFTEEDGELCAGTAPETLADFVWTTGRRVRTPVKRRFTEEEVARLDAESAKAGALELNDWIFTDAGLAAIKELARDVL